MRLGLVLYHEEHRVGYMTQQMRSLMAAHDEVTNQGPVFMSRDLY